MTNETVKTAAEWRAAAEENSRYAASQADELLAVEARRAAAYCNEQADRVEAEHAQPAMQASPDRATSGRCRADCVPCAVKSARRRSLVVLLYVVGFAAIGVGFPAEGLLGAGLGVMGIALIWAGWFLVARRAAVAVRPVFRGGEGGS